jgi:hypothetical protein
MLHGGRGASPQNAGIANTPSADLDIHHAVACA